MSDENEAIGKKITAARVDDDGLSLTFEDGSRLRLSDEGQSCCERRYMTCDDDLSKLSGEPYAGYEVKDSEYKDEEYDVHEVQFLEVKAGISSITLETHNEHNGYYGGFWVVARYTK